MEKWIIYTVRGLLASLERCHSSGSHNDGALLVSVMTVVCIAYKTTSFNQLSEHDCEEIADLMEISYQTHPNEQGSCPAYEALLRHLPMMNFR